MADRMRKFFSPLMNGRANFRCRWIVIFSRLLVVFVGAVGSWVQWGDWPGEPTPFVPWRPDAIVVLGGGDVGRSFEALRLAKLFPDAPVVVTGDEGIIVKSLLGGMNPNRITHEPAATSTLDNARLTKGILCGLKADRVGLVTNWFHVPRALAVFRHEQGERQFAASFEPRPAIENAWHRHFSRRERLAVLMYGVVHGIWSF